MASSDRQAEGQMNTSCGQSQHHVATSSHMKTFSHQPEAGNMETSCQQPEGRMDMSASRGDFPVSDFDMACSDKEHEGLLVPAGSAEHEEVLELDSQAITLSTGEQHSGNAQAANVLNIVTGGAGQGTLGRDTLDLRTDEARKIFAPTEAYRKVKQKLKEFGHVTICGASGEGKTTMALVLGSQYRQKGYEVVFVDSLKKFDFDRCLSTYSRVFLIVDDLFGAVGVSANTSHVKNFLNNLLPHLEQKQRAEEKRSELSDTFEESRKKMKNLEDSQTKDVQVVFTSKSYNFHDGLTKLQYEGFKLFKGQTVVDLTKQDIYRLSDKERESIYEKHKHAFGECSGQHIPDYQELEICSNIFGFPLICKLCFEFSSFVKSAKLFFKEPLFYLRLELKQLLEDRNDRSASLVLMLLCEDKLNLTRLDSGDEDKEMDTMVKTV